MRSEGSHDTNVIINNTLLSGIQNVSFQQNYNEEPVSLLGNGFASTVITSPPTTTAKVDKLLLNRDFITGLSGSTGISGYLVYGENHLKFDGATLDGYSLSVDINSNPAISFDFTIYGDVSGDRNYDATTRAEILGATKDRALAEISATGLQVTFSDDETIGAGFNYKNTNANPIQSFNFTETYQYQPKYKIGDHKPCQVDLINPIQQSATISVEVEEHSIKDKYSSIPEIGPQASSNYRDKTVTITMITKNGDKNIFQLENGHLVSETISAGVGDTVVANFTYRGYKTLGS